MLARSIRRFAIADHLATAIVWRAFGLGLCLIGLGCVGAQQVPSAAQAYPRMLTGIQMSAVQLPIGVSRPAVGVAHEMKFDSVTSLAADLSVYPDIGSVNTGLIASVAMRMHVFGVTSSMPTVDPYLSGGMYVLRYEVEDFFGGPQSTDVGLKIGLGASLPTRSSPVDGMPTGAADFGFEVLIPVFSNLEESDALFLLRYGLKFGG